MESFWDDEDLVNVVACCDEDGVNNFALHREDKKMTKRLNVTISGDLYNKISKLSEDSGMTLSGICTMCIISYFDQREAMSAMNNVNGLIKKLEEIEAKIK